MRRSAADSEAKSHSRKDKKPNMLRMFFVIVAVLLLIYLIAAIVVSVNRGVTTIVALNGAVSEDIRTTGYIFKDQDIITAPSGGYLKCMVSEGERVKSGQVLAYLFAVEPEPAHVQNIKDVHRLLRVKSGEVTESTYVDDGYSSSGATSQRVRNLSDRRSDRDLSIARDKKEDLNNALNRADNQGDRNKSLAELQDELYNLLIQAGGGLEIKATKAGVFSARIDGFEEKLAYANANTATPSYIEELDKIEPSEQGEIVAGQPLCKIVNNYNWSYATNVDEKHLENVKVGQNVEIEFYDLAQNSVAGRIVRISDAEGGKKTVVISTNKHVEGIYSTSHIGADIILKKAEGIKLPSKSIHVLDGVTGVYVIRLDKAQFVPVNVRYRNDDWTIVSAAEPELGGTKLRIYDEVIVSGKNIKNNELVR